jgi:hypothetical protein
MSHSTGRRTVLFLLTAGATVVLRGFPRDTTTRARHAVELHELGAHIVATATGTAMVSVSSLRSEVTRCRFEAVARWTLGGDLPDEFARLSPAQVRARVKERIAAQYRRGEIVRHAGWHLSALEEAILAAAQGALMRLP